MRLRLLQVFSFIIRLRSVSSKMPSCWFRALLAFLHFYRRRAGMRSVVPVSLSAQFLGSWESGAWAGLHFIVLSGRPDP